MLPKSNNVNSVVFEKHTTTKDEIKALLARMPDFLTAKEIAHILRISVKTMYQWTQDNYLPGRKWRGCRRFLKSDVIAWLEQQR